MVSLRCCTQAFSSCGQQGLFFIEVFGLLTAVAFLLQSTGSRHTGLAVQWLRLCISTVGLIPVRGTEILYVCHAAWPRRIK